MQFRQLIFTTKEQEMHENSKRIEMNKKMDRVIPAVSYSIKLFTQIHAPVFIQLAEVRISQIFNETDCFPCTFHFRS